MDLDDHGVISGVVNPTFITSRSTASMLTATGGVGVVDKYAGTRWKGYSFYFLFTLLNSASYIVAGFLY
jgi:hypothetical protein